MAEAMRPWKSGAVIGGRVRLPSYFLVGVSSMNQPHNNQWHATNDAGA